MASNLSDSDEEDVASNEGFRSHASDPIEFYAYRTSFHCVKFDKIKILTGGIYDWHPLVLSK